MDIPINYWAVLAGAMATMVLGALWYGPLFGTMWSDLMGWGEMSPERLLQKQKGARWSYLISFVGALVMSYVFAHAIVFGSAYVNAYGVTAGLMAAFWYWLGFIVPVTMGTVIWDGKPWKLWVINAGYYLVALLAMGAILAGWQ